MKKRLPLLAGLLCLAVSCQNNRMEEPLLESDTLLLKVGDTVVHTFDEANGQLGFSPDRYEFRVSNDDMSDYFVLSCSEMPVEAGQSLKANIVWTGRSGVQRRSNVPMKVQKIQGGTIWLWSSREHVAAIVKELR